MQCAFALDPQFSSSSSSDCHPQAKYLGPATTAAPPTVCSRYFFTFILITTQCVLDPHFLSSSFRLPSAGEIPGPGNPLPHHERFVRGVLFYLHVYFNAMRPLPSLPLLYSVCHPQEKFRQNSPKLTFQPQVMKMGEGEPTGKRFLDRLYFPIH